MAKAVKQCSIHFLSVELWIRRYNEETKFSVTPSFVLTTVFLKYKLYMICGDAISFPIIFSLPAQWFIKVYFVAGTPPITSNLILREISKTSKVSIRHNSVSRAITGRKKKWCQEAKKGVHLRCKLTISEIIQDLEGFSWDLGFVRDSRKRKISWRGTGFDHNSASGIPQNVRSGCGVGKENGIRDDKDDRSSGCGIVRDS